MRRRWWLAFALLFGACARDNPVFGVGTTSATAGASTQVAGGSGSRGAGASTGATSNGDEVDSDDPVALDLGPMTCRPLDEHAVACAVAAPGDCPPGKTCSPLGSEDEGIFRDARCVEATGTVDYGELCHSACFPSSGIDDCRPDAFCLEDAARPGHCMQLCADDAQCGDEIECVPFDAAIAVGLCLRRCHPFDVETFPPCGGADNCMGGPMGFHCMPHAGKEGPHAGQPCVHPFDCDAGQVCSDSPLLDCGDERCCAPLCEFGRPVEQGCPSAQCVPYTDSPPLLYATVGVCIVP